MKTENFPAAVCTYCNAPLEHCTKWQCKDCKQEYEAEVQARYDLDYRKKLNTSGTTDTYTYDV